MKKERLTVSLIIPHYQNMFSTFYALEIIKAVSWAAVKCDVDLFIATSWKAHPTCGILFADMTGNEEGVRKAKKAKLPYLILNYYEPDAKYNCIGIDNGKAAFEAVNYLIQSGHRRIAMITGKLNAQAGVHRLEGFKKAIKSAKLDLDKRYILTGDWTMGSGRKAMQKLLLLARLPSAVFVAGDEMAIGAMEAARQAGLKIPDDISFVGFDNIPQAELTGVSLTTIEQPFSDLASLGIKYLVQIIKEKPKQPVQVLLDSTKLIKRSSVKELSTK